MTQGKQHQMSLAFNKAVLTACVLLPREWPSEWTAAHSPMHFVRFWMPQVSYTRECHMVPYKVPDIHGVLQMDLLHSHFAS